MSHSARQLVHIVSETNRKVLTVDGSESKPGARVVVRAASESPSMYQLWYEDESGIIRSTLNDYALEGRFAGDQFVIMPFLEENPHQRWAFHGSKITKINLPPDCIDIGKPNDKDDAPVIEHPYADGALSQHWHVENIMPA